MVKAILILASGLVVLAALCFIGWVADVSRPDLIDRTDVLRSAREFMPLPANARILNACGEATFPMGWKWQVTFSVPSTNPAKELEKLARTCSDSMKSTSPLAYEYQQGDLHYVLEYLPEDAAYRLRHQF